jgi:putative endonuclease
MAPATGHGEARALGRRGEDLAAEHYRAAGFEVLARNWRCDAGEIDLVCRSGATVVVCEVKSRSSASHGVPAEAVGRAKQARLRRLAARYLAESGLHGVRVRFDVVSVLGGVLESYVDAF